MKNRYESEDSEGELDFDQEAIFEGFQDSVNDAGEHFDIDKQFENTENPEEEKSDVEMASEAETEQSVKLRYEDEPSGMSELLDKEETVNKSTVVEGSTECGESTVIQIDLNS